MGDLLGGNQMLITLGNDLIQGLDSVKSNHRGLIERTTWWVVYWGKIR